MEETGRLVEAARGIRLYLPQIVDDPGVVDSQLVSLLGRTGTGEAIEEELAAVFQSQPQLLDWVSSFVEHGVPPETLYELERGVSPLPGIGSPIDVPRYTCPIDGNFTFYRRHVGQEIPLCPDHKVSLVPG